MLVDVSREVSYFKQPNKNQPSAKHSHSSITQVAMVMSAVMAASVAVIIWLAPRVMSIVEIKVEIKQKVARE